MKRNLLKRTSALVLSFTMLTSTIAFGHSGRTDSNGGHRDNKNVSGLGSYHYHCGGYPAHLHTGGVCPYKSSAKPSSSSTSSSSSSTSTRTTTSSPKTTATYARVPNFPVKISGVDINTASAEYPPLLYNHITYIPLTSDILNYLDLSYVWNDSSNLIFNRKARQGSKKYAMQFNKGSSWYGNTVQMNVVKKGILANGSSVSNQYPAISYKGINYLPLTTEIITNLGLKGGWSQTAGFDLNLK